ncbi:MAG TPA: UDP-N-acetylglucosamine 2-epimerase (non-hydrolyzing) [Gaiellaceae bacterium]|nr:UDP-N-acetylglucosamine 2-epimerase (non-hydrolyzing) [Gaiellaceae bacterium]
MARSVCFVVGARPNFMKTAPVVRALRERHPEHEVLLVHSGQHYDPAMSDVFFRELAFPEPDVYLGVGSGTHGVQTARALEGVEAVLLERRPSLVVVPGDVNSTLAAALAAVKLHIPVAHLEAGLRSFDRTMPEEHNRVLTDHVSDLLLTHSESAVANLQREGIDRDRVHLVGNTMIDSLFAVVDRARALEPWAALGLERRGYALVTLHRPELVDDSVLLASTAAALAELNATAPVVFPVHPRTAARLRALGLDRDLRRAGVQVVDPLPYLEFVGLEAEAAFVVTDSGGVQEETSALGVRCFTLRNATERPVTVELGTNTVLGAHPERIADIAPPVAEARAPAAIPLWDGRAGERASDVIAAHVDAGRPLVAAD